MGRKAMEEEEKTRREGGGIKSADLVLKLITSGQSLEQISQRDCAPGNTRVNGHAMNARFAGLQRC